MTTAAHSLGYVDGGYSTSAASQQKYHIRTPSSSRRSRPGPTRLNIINAVFVVFAEKLKALVPADMQRPNIAKANLNNLERMTSYAKTSSSSSESSWTR
ncbi:hypothetical protein ABG768_023433 [Culter alburnus]|uniref:Uncharacterized protein n=1 Tax=Culter alburnus TaxID=194366 RepID=A0AAW2AQM1_CULAL